mmetsp:Transcript_13816/g.15343  ORF Transcript_13816/g.15343 Transcript_13816/m.15343 type:complete len:356 (-) Transcript_13816:100-1167(-)
MKYMNAMNKTNFVVSFFYLNTILLLAITDAFQQPFLQRRKIAYYAPTTTLHSATAEDNDDGINNNNNRRRHLIGGVSSVIINSILMPSNAGADVGEKIRSTLDLTQASSTKLPSGLLECRVLENVLSPPTYGMESSDVFYPNWFAGSWTTFSECTAVEAPCGISFFGGENKYQAAIDDTVGKSKALEYNSRFLRSDESSVISDREFNVRNIVKVSMGENSVVDIPTATPNKFSCVLSPVGSPSMLSVELLTLKRRQEKIDDTHFDCAEVVREIVSPLGQQASSSISQRRATILKEVETTSLYTFVDSDNITCRQRSATFLLPSQQDPMALRMWQATGGRPVDVRFYDVQYTQRKT